MVGLLPVMSKELLLVGVARHHKAVSRSVDYRTTAQLRLNSVFAPKGRRAVATGEAQRNPWNRSSAGICPGGAAEFTASTRRPSPYAPSGLQCPDSLSTGFASLGFAPPALHPWLQAAAPPGPRGAQYPLAGVMRERIAVVGNSGYPEIVLHGVPSATLRSSRRTLFVALPAALWEPPT